MCSYFSGYVVGLKEVSNYMVVYDIDFCGSLNQKKLWVMYTEHEEQEEYAQKASWVIWTQNSTNYIYNHIDCD